MANEKKEDHKDANKQSQEHHQAFARLTSLGDSEDAEGEGKGLSYYWYGECPDLLRGELEILKE